MASKTQRKSAKRNATTPARVAVASGNQKVSPRKSAKAAKKGAGKKGQPRKAPPKKVIRKPAPKKAVKKATPKKAAKKAPPKKSIKKAPKKAAPKATKKAAPPRKPAKVVKAPPPKKAAPPAKALKAAKVVAPAKAAPAPKPTKAAAKAAPVVEEREAPQGATPPGPPVGTIIPAAPAGPRKRGRKRRDPLEDLLKPEKRRGRPGRPRKRGSLAELMPKRPRLRKRVRARRGDEDMDLPVAPRPPAPRDSMTPEEIRADVLARYLRGETPPCPVGCGGMAQVVRVSTTESGAGEIWLECLSCAQRERFEVPAPTEAERAAIFATLEAGNEPTCPRHDRWLPLRRRGRDMVCPECGILVQGR